MHRVQADGMMLTDENDEMSPNIRARLLLEKSQLLEVAGGKAVVEQSQGKTASEIWHALLKGRIPEPYRSGLLTASRLENQIRPTAYGPAFEYIASGGMATVWCAWSTHTREPAALKLFHHTYTAGTQDDFFDTELAVLQQLSNKRTEGGDRIAPQQLFAGQGDDDYPHPYIGMEYCDGVTEADILKKWGRYSLRYAAYSLMDDADKLLTLERMGLVDLDAKPANILIDVRNCARLLCDFGIVRSPGTISGETMVGTPHYFAPEQCMIAGEEHTFDPHLPVYALGQIAFERLTGKTLQSVHGMPAIHEIVRCKREGLSAQDIRELEKSTPKIVADFVRRMLAIEANDRPSMEDCRTFFLRLHLGMNKALLPTEKRKGVRSFRDYVDTMDGQERRVLHFGSSKGHEDPLHAFRNAPETSVELNIEHIVDALRDRFPVRKSEPAFSLPRPSSNMNDSPTDISPTVLRP